MRKRFLIPTIAMMTAAAMFAGCGSGTASEISKSTSLSSNLEDLIEAKSGNSTDDENDNDSGNVSETADADDSGEKEEAGEAVNVSGTVTGKVKEVSSSSITLEEGTIADGGSASDIELSGKETTYQFADDVAVEFARPEMPDGEMPQMPDGEMPEMPNGEMPQMPDGEMPQMPDGEMPEKPGESGSSDTGSVTNSDTNSTPPAKPGESNGSDTGSATGSDTNSAPPQMPGGMDLSIEDISEDDIVSIGLDSDGNVVSITILSSSNMPQPPSGQSPGGTPGGSGNEQGGPGGAPGGSSADINYTALTEYTSDMETSGETYASTGTDENAVLVTGGASVTIDEANVTRDSDDSSGGDNASFYGVGAAILATDGTVKVSDSTIATDAKGGAGVFAYGDGTAYIENCTITTEQDTSGGIHAAGGGTLYATDCNVTTQGGSSAAIRSDRGGGTMVVDGGTYTSNGSGSPAVYSTADITVNDATLTANGSEAICIEGLNSITLTDCDLTGNMPDNEQNDCTWNVILYQSMSGDSEIGNSTFSMTDGSLTAKNGGMFYTTNTESTFILENVDITYADDSEFFLKCTGNSNARGWGQTGSNGADCSFTAIDQDCEGNIIWDSISVLDFYLTDESTLTGAVIDDESNAGNGSDGSGSDGSCSLYISADSTWIVTADSTLTNLNSEGTIVDTSGKTVTIVDADGNTLVKGNSSVTVTVTGEYSESI